ncbi:MAG: DUF4337 family protein [Verrucomicrobiota bacterium]
MKTKIPEQLKADVPPSKWGKILAATPVVMTVIATLLAGLASSEMTRAQYDRAFAAQLQSKAGDQWNFFQAKRLRGAIQHNALDILEGTANVRPLNADALRKFDASLEKADAQPLVDALLKGALPPITTGLDAKPEVKAALDAIEESKPETDIANALAKVDVKTLDDALRSARDKAAAFDTATGPINRGIERLEKALLQASAQDNAVLPLKRDFTGARLAYTALRYETEARLNQAVASIYELKVRKSNISAERHHKRSQKFFFGMLAAQAGVIIATFALAARARSLLWSLAAAAGLAAILFAIYVYLYV